MSKRKKAKNLAITKEKTKEKTMNQANLKEKINKLKINEDRETTGESGSRIFTQESSFIIGQV